MLYQTLHRLPDIEICHPPALTEFWEKWMVGLQALLHDTSGVLMSGTPQFLPGCPRLERWIFSRVALVSPREEPLQFVPLSPEDTGHGELWCVVCTAKLQVVLVSSEIEGKGLFSCHPHAIALTLQLLLDRIADATLQTLLKRQLETTALRLPDYLSLSHLMKVFLSPLSPIEVPIPEIQEIDILQSMMHEVRTPLTTIRMLLHSLLKRKDLTLPVQQRLEQIERESKEQIDRFNLIFQVVEQAQPILRESILLQEVLHELLPHWRWQCERRQLDVEYLSLSPELPPILSNGPLLIQLLNGLIDRMNRSLPPQSRIQIQSSLAGGYLKLEFLSFPRPTEAPRETRPIGQWLLLQPETGTLSLSIPVTKALFQSLGGKLTLRIHPTFYDGEILTLFLPLFST